jgi:hypothetical protein
MKWAARSEYSGLAAYAGAGRLNVKRHQEDMDMLLLLFVIALTDAQQARHDATERVMYQRIQADKATISDLWRPSPRLLSDYNKAHACYVQFHLYRVTECDALLDRVDRDLGSVEIAGAEGR